MGIMDKGIAQTTGTVTTTSSMFVPQLASYEDVNNAISVTNVCPQSPFTQAFRNSYRVPRNSTDMDALDPQN